MKVFITGGTGLIGSAVVAELLTHGHEVVALARSDASAQAAETAGATALRGSLGDLDVIRAGTQDADGVIHLAFSNDFSSPEAVQRAMTEEAEALAVMGEALVGTGKPLVTVSGTPIAPGRAASESDPLPTDGLVGARGRAVEAALSLAAKGVRSSSVRLPRTVHDDGRGGFAGVLTEAARASGTAGYPGDGTQRWPAVHAKDAAALFRLALEKAPAGTAWHAVADEGDAVRDMMTVVGRRLGLPVAPVDAAVFGPLGEVFVLDQPASSAHTRETLGWEPRHPSLLADLENVQA